jgi:pullulanase
MLLSLSITSCKSKNKEASNDSNSAASDENNKQQLPDTSPEFPSGKREITFAEMIDFNKIQYTLSKGETDLNTCEDDINIKVFDGKRAITVLNINADSASDVGTIELGEELDITKSYSLEIEGYGKKTVIPTFVFDTEEFINGYCYRGNDLGATLINGKTTFKVWAPTASRVVLNLFNNENGSAYSSVDMTKGDMGVWSCIAECGHGTYYTYSVTTQIGTNESTDPYAKATSFDGKKSAIIDLSMTNPDGWGNDFKVGIDSYSDAIIWAVDPEEFSYEEEFNYSGYLAFTERGLVNENGESIGVDYLIKLGVTHINLLPVYGYEAHIDSNSKEVCRKNYYNSPNPIFSSSPHSPSVVIKEYKEMVQALHNVGIGVIASVDYAHTDDEISAFDKIVPYYYHSHTDGGIDTSLSGCGKDLASERYMFSKFITDSLSYLLDEYDLDGFSLETMYLHGIETVDKIEKAVHGINPEAIIIGKCKSDSGAAAKEIGSLTPHDNAIGGVAVFNDAMCDGFVKTVFGEYENYYADSFSAVLNGIKGVIADEYGDVETSCIVNSMMLGDETAWADISEQSRLASLRLYITLLAISKSSIYIDAGEEFSLIHNDRIDWSLLNEENEMYGITLHLIKLLKIRNDYDIFTDQKSVVYANLLPNIITLTVTNPTTDTKILVVSNLSAEDVSYHVDGSWYTLPGSADSTTDGVGILEGRITVPAYTAIILTNNITCIG